MLCQSHKEDSDEAHDSHEDDRTISVGLAGTGSGELVVLTTLLFGAWCVGGGGRGYCLPEIRCRQSINSCSMVLYFCLQEEKRRSERKKEMREEKKKS